MKIIEEKRKIRLKYPLEKLADIKDILFFDIETTGFSPGNSQIYIIGVAYIDTDTPVTIEENSFLYTFYIRQLFAQSLSDEILILKDFIELSKHFKVLLHFNGDNFDIPFVEKSLKQYNISDNLSALISIDLYKKIRSLKKLLSLDRLNQTSIEKFLGIDRKDVYNGGELIYIYSKYIKSPGSKELNILLLHNFEDVCGLITICSMLSYFDFFKSNFKYLNHSIDKIDDVNSILTIHCSSDISLPNRLNINNEVLNITIDNNHMEICYRIYSGIAKYFFNNYKDYFYLPAEDSAIHKSVGVFVDKAAKKKATKDTAYIKKNSTYLMIYGDIGLPVFSKDYSDKYKYVELSDIDFNDIDFMNSFIKNTLSNITI